MSGCGHVHANRYQALACKTVQVLAAETGFSACVVIYHEDETEPAISIVGNASGMAVMARLVCQLAGQMPRPTDCAACADAWDRMAQASAILGGLSGRC